MSFASKEINIRKFTDNSFVPEYRINYPLSIKMRKLLEQASVEDKQRMVEIMKPQDKPSDEPNKFEMKANIFQFQNKFKKNNEGTF